MNPIRRLPEALIREIAAGETIGGPADALRELLENALDAGADRIEVRLEAGGIERIVVRDNGRGIPAAELPLAVEQHHSSKLDDLARITTLGFRGEGLHALRQAARLRLTSRPAEQLGGATVTVWEDALTSERHPAPAGTRAEVTRLFERLPARRRALAGAAAEERACQQLLWRYLLHHPELKLTLHDDHGPRWSHAGGSVVDVVKAVWGAVTANRLLPLDVRRGDLAARGALSRPELTRARRDRLQLAVNGRPVVWPDTLLRALLRGYGELLPAGQMPVGVVSLTLPPEAVLVNAAPDKGRVRLLDERIAPFLEGAVRAALAAQPLAPAAPTPNPAGPAGVNAAPRHAFPALRHLGIFRDLYLLAEGNRQLWLVDQHAAHERVIYETLEERYRNAPPVELPHPELIELSEAEAARYRAAEPELTTRGLTLEPFGGGRWRLRQVPAFLTGFPQLAADVARGCLGDDDLDRAWRRVLGRFACLPAVKAGHPLGPGGAQALLDALSGCTTPRACPHGRPTALVLSELELARRFGRRGIRAEGGEVGSQG